jgi:hypothetical protein
LAAYCGLGEDEFWGTTPRYLSARQKAKERELHLSWEQTRFLSYTIFKTVDSKNKIRKVQDVCKFPWEVDVPKFVEQTREQLQAFSDDADEVLRLTQPEVYKKFMEAKQNAKNGSTST